MHPTLNVAVLDPAGAATGGVVGDFRHFSYLDPTERARLFHRPPEPFSRAAGREQVAAALGATLYMPATRPCLATDLARQARRGVVSAVACLEDAVADGDVPEAERNLVRQLRACHRRRTAAPLVFVRVRTVAQLERLLERLGDDVGVLSGIVIPKFTAATGAPFLELVAEASQGLPHPLLAMPVLESPEIIHRETRIPALLDVQQLLARHREHVLAVRIGAADLCSAYGIRRDRSLTAYDIRPLADAIGDVVNVFAREDGTGYSVTGPVWEYFGDEAAGLAREVTLDRANGLTGKTVIHPSHTAVVHALSVVSHEEYTDAVDILDGQATGGAVLSRYGNKMNEGGPHRAWARRVLRRAAAFGVARLGVTADHLLTGVLP